MAFETYTGELVPLVESDSTSLEPTQYESPQSRFDFIMPVTGKVGGGFGEARGNRQHSAGDLYANPRDPVFAPGNMELVAAGVSRGPGTTTNMDRAGDAWSHWKDLDTGHTYKFAHHSPVGYRPGDVVPAGEPFTEVGGLVDKPHLHMGVVDSSGKHVDWLSQFNLNRGKPVEAGLPGSEHAYLSATRMAEKIAAGPVSSDTVEAYTGEMIPLSGDAVEAYTGQVIPFKPAEKTKTNLSDISSDTLAGVISPPPDSTSVMEGVEGKSGTTAPEMSSGVIAARRAMAMRVGDEVIYPRAPGELVPELSEEEKKKFDMTLSEAFAKNIRGFANAIIDPIKGAAKLSGIPQAEEQIKEEISRKLGIGKYGPAGYGTEQETGEQEPSMIEKGLGIKAGELLHPTDERRFPMDRWVTIPGSLAGTVASYAVPGATFTKTIQGLRGPGVALKFYDKLLSNVLTFGAVDIPRGYEQAGAEGVKQSLWHSPLTAFAFTVGGLPSSRLGGTVGVGFAGAASTAAGGEYRIDRLIESFGTMAVLHNIMHPGGNPKKVFEDWAKDNSVKPQEVVILKDRLEALRKQYEADKATPAQRAPEPTPEEVAAEVTKLQNEYRQGIESPILTETLTPEVLATLRAGKPVSAADTEILNAKIKAALIGERTVPEGVPWEQHGFAPIGEGTVPLLTPRTRAAGAEPNIPGPNAPGMSETVAENARVEAKKIAEQQQFMEQHRDIADWYEKVKAERGQEAADETFRLYLSEKSKEGLPIQNVEEAKAADQDITKERERKQREAIEAEGVTFMGSGPFIPLAEKEKLLAPVFFSKMESYLADPKFGLPARGQGKDWASLVEAWERGGKFKKRELEVSGLIPWLREQTGVVTKQQVLDKMKEVEGEQEVGVVVKGEVPGITAASVYELREMLDDGIINQEEYDILVEQNREKKPAIFQSYVKAPPGGTGYVELYLTMPPKYEGKTIFGEPLTKGDIFEVSSGHGTGDPAADINRFAHIFGDTRIINGKKYFAIWELQSDWAARGRMEGYSSGKSEYFLIDPAGRRVMGFEDKSTAESYLNDYENKGYTVRKEKVPGVPPFPFSHNWMEVALKQALRYAVESGHDGLAWATGDMVKDRYDLSEVYNSVQSEKITKGYRIVAPDGRWVEEYNNIAEAEFSFKHAYMDGVDGHFIQAEEVGYRVTATRKDTGDTIDVGTFKDAKAMKDAGIAEDMAEKLVTGKPIRRVDLEVALQEHQSKEYNLRTVADIARNNLNTTKLTVENAKQELKFYQATNPADILGIESRVDSLNKDYALLDNAEDKVIAAEDKINKWRQEYDKILRDFGKADVGKVVLTDLDLKLGGEWANRQYDGIDPGTGKTVKGMPQFLGGYGKQWGARVGEDKIEAKIRFPEEEGYAQDEMIHTLPFTPQLKDAVLFQGQPKFMTKEIKQNAETEIRKAEGREEVSSATLDQATGKERNGTVSEVEAGYRRELEDFRARRSQEPVRDWQYGEAERNVWTNIEYSPWLAQDSRFQAASARAKSMGIDHVIPVKSNAFNGGFYPDPVNGKMYMFLEETGNTTNTFDQIMSHELFHQAVYNRDRTAIELMGQIDYDSNTFRRFKDSINRTRKFSGLDRMTNKDIREELVANWVADMKTVSAWLRMNINLDNAFSDLGAAKKLRQEYWKKESAVSEGGLTRLTEFGKAESDQGKLSIKGGGKKEEEKIGIGSPEWYDKIRTEQEQYNAGLTGPIPTENLNPKTVDALNSMSIARQIETDPPQVLSDIRSLMGSIVGQVGLRKTQGTEVPQPFKFLGGLGIKKNIGKILDKDINWVEKNILLGNIMAANKFGTTNNPINDFATADMTGFNNRVRYESWLNNIVKKYNLTEDIARSEVELAQRLGPIFERYIEAIQPSVQLKARANVLKNRIKNADLSTPIAKETIAEIERLVTEAKKPLDPVLAKEIYGARDVILKDLKQKYANVRIKLAAGGDKESLSILTPDELIIMKEVRKYYDIKKSQLREQGIKTIREDYVNFVFDHGLSQRDPGAMAFIDGLWWLKKTKPSSHVLDFIARTPGSSDWFPLLYQSMRSYIPSVERKLAFNPWLDKWMPKAEEWEAAGHRNISGWLNDFWKKNFSPDALNVAEKGLNLLTDVEYARTLALNLSVPALHLFKLLQTPAWHGPIATLKGLGRFALASLQKLKGVQGPERQLLEFYIRLPQLIKSVEQTTGMDKVLSPGFWKNLTMSTTAAIEYFDNGVNLFANMERAARTGADSYTTHQLNIDTLLRLNGRGYTLPTWTTSPTGRLLTMYSSQPMMLVQSKGDLLVKTLKGVKNADSRKDEFGDFYVNKLARMIMFYGLAFAGGAALGYDLTKHIFHFPGLVQSPKTGETTVSLFTPPMQLAKDVVEDGFNGLVDHYTRIPGIDRPLNISLDKVPNKYAGSFSYLFNVPNRGAKEEMQLRKQWQLFKEKRQHPWRDYYKKPPIRRWVEDKLLP